MSENIQTNVIPKEEMELINKLARRELSEEEIYTFPVILCDNETDRDCERFSISALYKLAELFVGKTGIFDHDPKGANQTARIYSTEVISDPERKTRSGEVYTALKAKAYMMRTEKNVDFIKEIDGGIKKEVSVGCSIKRETCSICGADRRSSPCSHIKGNYYKGKFCEGIFDEPTDAYEWSFVAVPAQPNAGITKSHGGAVNSTPNDDIYQKTKEMEGYDMDIEKIAEKLSSHTLTDGKTPRYVLLNVMEDSIGVIDRKNYEAYMLALTEKDGDISIDTEKPVLASLSVCKSEAATDFSLSNEVKSLISAEEDRVSAVLGESYNAKYEELSASYSKLMGEHGKALEELEKYKNADEERKATEKRAEIDGIVENYSQKIGKLPKFLMYRSQIDYSKSAEQIKNELTVMAGEAVMNDTEKKSFSYSPVCAGVAIPVAYGASSAANERYGNLLDNVMNGKE